MVSLLNFETLRPLDVDALKFRTQIPVVFLLSLIVPVCYTQCHGVRGLSQDFLLLCTSNTSFPPRKPRWQLLSRCNRELGAWQ